jgi:hypothetical protein
MNQRPFGRGGRSLRGVQTVHQMYLPRARPLRFDDNGSTAKLSGALLQVRLVSAEQTRPVGHREGVEAPAAIRRYRVRAKRAAPVTGRAGIGRMPADAA